MPNDKDRYAPLEDAAAELDAVRWAIHVLLDDVRLSRSILAGSVSLLSELMDRGDADEVARDAYASAESVCECLAKSIRLLDTLIRPNWRRELAESGRANAVAEDDKD